MEPFSTHTGIVAPLDRANVDTDLIIPKQFLKSVERTGFGANLFDQLRYKDEGQPGQDCSSREIQPDFVLNRPEYAQATILLTGDNFGCGSSREHAAWALADYGFKVIIAKSFADIFYNNCSKNGILAIALKDAAIDQLFQDVAANLGLQLSVNLEQQTIISSTGASYDFDIDAYRKTCLLRGLDDIALTLESSHLIKSYEKEGKKHLPWLFSDI